jgi:hypothetical protein
MNDTPPTHQENVAISQLRPTQFTVGMLEVKHKRKRLRALEKRPAELVDFILEMPIRVVLGPAKKAYVIDHHHMALALLKEHFETAPMVVEANLSPLSVRAFWREMQRRGWVHPFDAKGRSRPIGELPKSLEDLKDDPYRSLAGFVRAAGGFAKTPAPFAEFQWADFFRERIDKAFLRAHFRKAIVKSLKLARSPGAADLPGYIGRRTHARP